MKFGLSFATACLLILTFEGGISTTTIYVSKLGSDYSSCGSKELPCRHVNTALAKSQENGKILIEGLFWREPASFTEDSLYISKAVQIIGINGAPKLIYKGRGTFIWVQSNKTALERNTGPIMFKNIKLVAMDKRSFIIYANDAVFITKTEFQGGNWSLHMDCKLNCHIKIDNCSFLGMAIGIRISNNFNTSINNTLFHGKQGFSPHAIATVKENSKATELRGNIEVENSIFKHFNSAININIKTGGEMKFRVTNCTFRDNAVQNGAAISIAVHSLSLNATTMSITRSFFIGNIGHYGGAVYLSSPAPLVFNITRCFFEANKGYLAGGAIYTNVSNSVYIAESQFIKNTCVRYAEKGFGGAIALSGHKDATYKTVLSKCHFVDNTATAMGGTLYSLLRSTKIELSDVVIESCKECQKRATDGDIAFLLSEVSMSSTTVEVNNPVSENNAFYIHNDCIEIHKSSSFICATGYQTVIMKINSSKESFSLFSVLCRTCPYNHYSLHKSSFHDLKIKNPTCFPCPSDSVCRFGISRPKDNFWGYKVNSSGPVAYIQLPKGYGCEGNECRQFNSCAKNREGVMCARCSKGYSEHVLVPGCISNVHCNKIKFWCLAAGVVMIYIILFLYKSEFFLLCKRNMNWLYFFKCKTEDEKKERDTMEEYVCAVAENEHLAVDGGQVQNSSSAKVYRHHDFGSGLLKIVFYFYQIEIILHENVGSEDNTVFKQLLQLTRSFFNFNFLATHDSDLCAFTNITPIKVEFLRIGLITVVFVGLGTVIVIARLLQKLPEANVASFMRRLGDRALSASFEIFVLIYAINVITGLKVLNCVSYKQEKRLLIQGDIKCFTSWQYLVMSVMSLWALPYCIFIFLLPKWLLDKKTNKKGILLGCLFPLPFLITMIYKLRQHEPFDGISSNVDDPVIGKILDYLVAPFKKLNRDREVFWWEGVYIFRRLLLIILVQFVHDPMAKIQLMLFSQIIFLFHHMHYKPFNQRFLNHLETASLTTLVMFTSASAVYVYDFKYGISNRDASVVPVIFSWLRVSIIITLPCVAAIAVAVPLILWFIRSIAKLITMFVSHMKCNCERG